MDWDFIQNAAVDSVDTVPETYRSYYEEDKTSGKFVLKADVKPLAESYTNTAKRLAGLTKTRAEDSKKDATRRAIVDQVNTMLTEFGWEPGDDVTKLPEVLKSKINELVESGKGGKEARLNVEAAKKAMEGQVNNLRQAHSVELGKMKGSLEKYMIDSAANSALAKAGTVDKGADLLLPMVRKMAKVVPIEDGEYAVRVLEADGSIRFNSRGTEMSVEELVADLKVQYPIAFKSEAKGGGGKPPGSSTNTRTAETREGRSSVDKIASGLKTLGK